MKKLTQEEKGRLLTDLLLFLEDNPPLQVIEDLIHLNDIYSMHNFDNHDRDVRVANTYFNLKTVFNNFQRTVS